MKTPREILLQKHAAADEQLDQIRAGVVRDLAAQGARKRHAGASTAWPGWAGLFWTLRGHLAALAGAWVLIALLSSSAGSDQSVLAHSKSTGATAELLLIARENRLQVRELLAPAETAETPVPAPRPRSQPEPGAMWPVKTNANC